jgi:hypothetical protein
MPRRPAGEERKVVTVLFCDLVGFTARSDRADPEDVGAILGRLEGRRRFEDARTMLAALDAALGAATRLGNSMTPGAEEEPA